MKGGITMIPHYLISRLMDREGGYVFDPDDPGGETKYGISKRSYPNIDIKNLTRADAEHIYYRDFYQAGEVDKVPESLQEIYLDMIVMSGIRRAIRILQQAVNHDSDGFKLKIDGELGSKTLEALQYLEDWRLRAWRTLFYADLVLQRPSLNKFWAGWFTRCISV
jgi:lysozyme family protein